MDHGKCSHAAPDVGSAQRTLCTGRAEGSGWVCVLTSPNHGACLGPEYVTAACRMVAEMVESLPSVLALGHKRNSNTPAFLTPVLRNTVISLARLPLVNSYTRVPPLVSLVLALQRQAPGRP